MSLLDQAEVMVIDDLSKGLDAYGGVLSTEKGHYPEAENMVLTRRVPATIRGTTAHNTTAAPNSENIIYAVVFTLVGGTSEHLVYTDGGTWYSLVGETYTQLRTGLDTAPTYLSHTPFRSRMVLANGTDAIQSYDGTTMLPVGGKLASNMSNTPTPAGTWAGGTNETTTVREGAQARSLSQTGTGTATMTVTYTATQNFQTGPQSGDPDFNESASGDTLRAQINVVSGAGNITRVRFRFETTAGVDFRDLDATGLVAGWNAISITRNSGGAGTGAPNWASIADLAIQLTTTGDAEVVVDDVLFQYGTNPVPVGNIVIVYNNFLLVGDQSADRVRLNFSAVSQIDDFPTANFVQVTGGGHSLEQGDRITGLKVYSSVVIIGKPKSIHALTGAPGSISVDQVSPEEGIDGHNCMVESPFALHYVYGDAIRSFRLTGRDSLSAKINPMFTTVNHGGIGPGLDSANGQAHVGIRHEPTHTLRWSLREVGGSQNSLQVIYDWEAKAWTSEVTYVVRHYHHAVVSGTRLLHATQYNGFLQILDQGTTFDGTAIASRLDLPWVAGPRKTPMDLPAVVRWLGVHVLLDGNTDVIVEYRVADTPTQATGAFSTAEGSPLAAASPDAETGFVGFGNAVGRFVQVRLRTTSGRMEVHPPVFLYYIPIQGRKGA